jgi:hypothetical protein
VSAGAARGPRATVRPLLAVGLGLGFGLLAAADFESYEEVEVGQILPASYLRSVSYTVDPRVRAVDNFYHFSVLTDLGSYAITSRAMLRQRLHEISVVAELMPRLEAEDEGFDRTPGGRRGVGSEHVVDILADPVGTAAQLLGNLQHNVEETFVGTGGEDPRARPAPAAMDLNPDPHKRSAAAQLGVDVYTSNPQLQAVLATLADARSSGEAQHAFSPLVRNRYAARTFGDGSLDARLESAIKNTASADLNERVVSLLGTLGVAARLRVAFLTHPAYTPRTRLYFASYLEVLAPVAGIEQLIEAANSAATEADAVAYVLYARMLASYQLDARNLVRVVTKARFPTLATSASEAVLALPIDYLAWTPEVAAAADTLAAIRRDEDLGRFVLLLAGRPTKRAIGELERRQVEIRPDYSL